MPTIAVTITPAGDMTIEVAGVAGPACEQLTAQLEAAVGTVTERAPTADAYAQEQSHITMTGGIG